MKYLSITLIREILFWNLFREICEINHQFCSGKGLQRVGQTNEYFSLEKYSTETQKL